MAKKIRYDSIALTHYGRRYYKLNDAQKNIVKRITRQERAKLGVRTRTRRIMGVDF